MQVQVLSPLPPMKRIKNGRDKYVLVTAPPDFPGWKHKGRYCYEHHLVWWRVTASVPCGDEVLHHINGDPTDNRYENLAKSTRSEHSRAHQLEKIESAPIEHGTYKQYRRGCRCSACRTGNAAESRRYKGSKGSKPRRAADHGSASMYCYHKCRCLICREGVRLRMRAYLLKKKSLKPCSGVC